MSTIERMDFAHSELLRFITCGSVDDGKSTLIGRLLHDSKSVFEDQLSAVARATERRGLPGIDLSLLTDGLQAEREQGITIDVAYRYFATPRRKFIIADTPGHEQYTRNMVTGASTASLAVILIDARKGMLIQSRRHAYIASLLGIPHLVVAVNKMDLVAYSKDVFDEIRDAFSEFAAKLGLRDVTYIPISALQGDMVVERGANLPWYGGPTLLSTLETIAVDHDIHLGDFRFPVQWVIRPGPGDARDFRGYAGRIESGTVAVGDEIAVLPSATRTRIKHIVTHDGDLEQARAPQSVTLRLADEIDASRGDMIVSAQAAPRVAKEFDAMLCWLGEQPLDPRRNYLLKQGTRIARATVAGIRHRVDVNTLELQSDVVALTMNDVGQAGIRVQQPLALDSYARNRATGSFIMIDEATHNTVGAGMVL